MSTKRPTAPAAGAALVSLSLSTVVPLTHYVDGSALNIDPQLGPLIGADVGGAS
jgi:hypothetical protein